MLRIMKKYSFAFQASPQGTCGTPLPPPTLSVEAVDSPIPGGVQAFSSYPGSIFSGDDFYILSSGLVTLETTIGNSNPALWKFVTPEGTVMEWLRNVIANRLAKTGKEWAGLFSKFNSGTYNNFMEDPLSVCQGCDPPHNGENAISARSDLNPANGTYPFGALKQRPHGGTDMKVTSFSLYRDYQLLAVSGPTWDQVPPFQWSRSPYSRLLHMGHPDTWAFPVVRVCWG
ncbi:UNVERIFIED_CONTAM: hypothetical protein FKN15_048196 [Acipenser sinensis]